MKTTAIAPANIAFIKYWGKKDESLRLPLNDSISMNLSAATTMTTVEFNDELKHDHIVDDGRVFAKDEILRITMQMSRLRELTSIRGFARVSTKNSFPKGIGSASSASGFAALTLAFCLAAGIQISEKELTIFARLGSGSACRSIPDGFVHWVAADRSEDSYAYSLFPSTYWDLQDVLIIVNENRKKVATSEGMESVQTSEFIKTRVARIPQKVKEIIRAFNKKDFTLLGEIIEKECLSMHAVMLTQKPALLYWQPETLEVIKAVIELRAKGIEAYYTIDAGPNVHVICEKQYADKISEVVSKLSGVKQCIMNQAASGARIVDRHIF